MAFAHSAASTSIPKSVATAYGKGLTPGCTLPLLDQNALTLLRQVAQSGIVQKPPPDVRSSEAALSRAGLIRIVVLDQEIPSLVLTARGVRASGALPWIVNRTAAPQTKTESPLERLT